MSTSPRRVVLLGSQRRKPDASAVLEDLGLRGPAALITAGWQEWEHDDEAVRSTLPEGSFNLGLHGRAEEVWRADRELAQAHRKLQARVRALRQAYNLRLEAYSEVRLALERLAGHKDVVDGERHDAMETVRRLDRHHTERIRELRGEFYHRWDPIMRHHVGHVRADLQRAIDGAESVVITGGHVPVLLNRLRLFAVDALVGDKTVLACSGAAMAVAPTIVLFHDSPPWGPGHSEVGEVGLGLAPDVVPLPNGSQRLRVDDRGRVARFARRYAPASCLLLDPGSRAEWDGRRWVAKGIRWLAPTGVVEEWSTA